jgi:His-Xaa-Ser system radical SAM maturase HxsB
MSKFKSLDAYLPKENTGYEILPFKFERLGGDVFVSNLVGEFKFLSEKDFQDFTAYNINPISELYSDLQSKHLLIERGSSISLELLALKLRTKLKRLSSFTALHLFVVSLRCEHSCPYCQVSRQSDNKVAFDMTQEIADKALDLTFQSPSSAIKIEFQGGEPLLNFPIIKYIVQSALEINKAKKKNLAFVIATNLAVISDEMLEFCKHYSIDISTSLDGPKDLHNSNRPRKGNNSYELTIAGIEKARNFLGVDHVSALMTTTKSSLGQVRDIIDEYVLQNFGGIFLRPLSPYGFAVKTKWYNSYGVDDWLKFYFEGLDYIIELNRNGLKFQEFYARMILTKMLTPYQTGYVDMMSPAGTGIAAVVYNYDGDVFASDESRMLAEMGDKTFCLGNVLTDSYKTIFTNDVLLEAIESSFTGSAPMCSDCAFEPYCGSDPVYHHTTQGDFVGKKWNSGFCDRNLTIFRKLVQYYRNPEIRNIFESWV